MKSLSAFISLILFSTPASALGQECFHPDGQPYFNHWLACGNTVIAEQAKNEAAKETITQWSARALLCEAALAEQDTPTLFKFDCDEFTDFTDGQGGRVWKPKSDNTGFPVFLLPPEYNALLPRDGVERVRVFFTSDGLEILEKDAYRDTEGANGGRYHHDVFIKTNEPLTIRLERADGFIECIEVDDASQRFD